MSLAKCLEQHAPPDRHDEIERAIKAQKLGQIKSIDNILAELRAEREDIVGQILAAANQPAEKAHGPLEISAHESVLDRHESWMQAIDRGKMAVDDYKAAFEQFVAEKDVTIAELSKLTKEGIFQRMGRGFAYRYKNEKKDYVARSAYDIMLMGFNLSDSFTYSMGQDKVDVLREKVKKKTQEDLDNHAKEAREEVAEREQQAEKVAAAVAGKLETLDDFKVYLRAKIAGGMTYPAARMSLSAEDRAGFDERTALETRGARTDRESRNRTTVTTATVKTTGEVIETKHTKTGEPLFVVQAGERVERDIYNQWNTTAKRMGGYYSSYRGGGAVTGFQFKTRDAAEAFSAFLGGEAGRASDIIKDRRDVFQDNQDQTAVERLRSMADALEERADENLNRDRKVNTARRAGMAARAESAAESEKALAKTMRNIAAAIDSGTVKFLDRVRQKIQVEMLNGFVSSAQYQRIKTLYPNNYAEYEKRKGEPPTPETADYAEFPEYTSYRSDLARLGRQLVEQDGTKKLGDRLLKVADDVTDAYLKFAKENIGAVSKFTRSDGGVAVFATKKAADAAIQRSGYKGKAIVLPFKRMQNIIILSPEAAVEAGVWGGDGDKRITLTADFGRELVEKAARKGVEVPNWFTVVKEKRERLAKMGIETPAEFRAGLREFITLKENAKAEDKVKKLEREMVGRAKDGLDFFPTPENVAQSMVEVADVQEGMSVLEPSAGMGHIAEVIRSQSGVDPDVVEMSSKRRELLEAKGFRVVGQDFMDITPRSFTFGDVFKSPDGTVGVMRGSGGLGSNRVGLQPLDENGDPDVRRSQWVDRDTLEEVEKRGSSSGYDRIIMNPPFSDRRDVAHVRHAYDLLRPGGRIVAIMGEGSFFGGDKKAVEFREWLESVGGTSEKLEGGTFNDPSLPVTTGVNTRMVVIDKAEDAKFSETTSPQPRTTSVLSELTTNLGKLRVRRLTSSGQVTILKTQDEAREVAGGKLSAAFHGSPHDFEKFRMDKLLTGEAANAYGSGLYFAGRKEVAEHYRRTLSGYDELTIITSSGKKKGNQLDDVDLEVAKYLESGERRAGQFKHNTVYYAKQSAESAGRTDVVERLEEYGRDARATYEKNKGRLYEVELAPDEQDYLLWDRPLSEQSEKVRKALDGNMFGFADGSPSEAHRGSDLYQYLSRNFTPEADESGMNGWTSVQPIENDRAASEYLHSLGIRGIKYLDGSSRGAGEGAHNYVLFSEDDVEIKVKYSKSGKIQGIYKDGRTYLVEDGIPEGQAMGVLLHELGEHAKQLGFAKDSEYQAILSSLEKRAELSGKTGDLIRNAISRIPKDTAAEHKWSEVAAYLVENHANDKIGFIASIVNFFKKWLFKAGGISADTFSEKDLVLFARAAVKAASGVSAREQAMFSMREKFQPVDTNSPAFKRWFGDSKVVDAEGKPARVYHGGAPGVEAFNIDKSGEILRSDWGKGIYFTPSPSTADYYRENYSKTTDVDSARSWDDMEKAARDMGTTPMSAAIDLGYGSEKYNKLQEYDRAWRVARKAAANGGQVYPVYLSMKKPLVYTYSGITDPFLSEHAIAKGHDGIIITDGEGDVEEIIVFSPTQIKSAISNTGDYSPTDGRIQYSVAAEPVTVEDVGEIVEQFKDKADISPVTSIFVTAEYTSAKDPAFKRAFEAAMRRGEEKVALGYYILDGVTRDDGPAAFGEKKDSLIKTFDGLNDSQSKEVEYLRETDKTGKAFRIKYVDGFTIKTPDGVYVGTAKTKEAADTLIRDHHKANNLQGKVLMEDYQTPTGMWQVWSNKNKLIKEFDNEADAVTATMEAEGKFLVKEGFSPEAINAILSFRAAMNRAFDLQVREWRKIVEMCKEKGWDIPTTETIDEDKRWAVKDKSGKTIATYAEKSEAELFSESMGRTNKVVRQADSDIRKTITLEDAIARMGDLRGSYFPRQRRSGAVTMVAVNEQTGEKILEEFDLYLLKGVKPEHETGMTNAKELLRSAANYGTPMARRMRELKRKGFTVSTKMTEKTPEQVFETAQLAASISALLNESIDKSKKSGDSKAERQAFEAIHQAVVLQVADLFKQRGALSSRMKRSEEYWEGFETDPLKAAVQYAKSMAGGIAKREAAQEMTLAITGRDITWKQWKGDNPKGEYGDYMKFVKDRALDPVKQPNLYKEYFSWSKEVLRNDEQADRIIGTLRGLATLKYLGLRPAAAVVNLTNFFQAVPATISTDTGRSIKSALAQVNRSLAARHAYNKGKAGDLDANIFAGIVERGWDQAQYSHEAAGVLRSKAGNVGAWISDKMMAMFAWSERVNRATTIHAAYMELMRSKGIEKPNAEQHEELMVGAREISDRAHGIYGKETAPVWTRGQFNPLRMTWTFAKFSQNYMLNMGRMVGKGDYKNAAWMLLSPGVLGGAGASLATPVIVALMKAFGIGGDDPEEELYKWVESQLGSDSLARHGLPGLVGVNFKGSLAANIPFPTTLSEIFGAPGSVVTDVKEAAVHAGRGEFLKAGEKLLPSAFSAPIRAYRESTEGITTGTYSPVYHGKEQLKADPWDAFLRASSFNPSRLSGIREKQWKEKTRAKSYLEERTEINSMIKKAWINGGYRLSRADLARMKVYIDEYNDRVKNLKLPGVSPITEKSIKLLLKRNAKASKFEAERE